MTQLDARLLAAHETGNTSELVSLYTEAADTMPEGEARYFYLTQAYVFALEIDHPAAPTLKSRLVSAGREEIG